MSGLRVGVVIPTIGRSRVLGNVLASLSAQTHPLAGVVVADQSGGGAVATLADGAPLAVRRVTGGVGTSAGKNRGLAALGKADVVVFLDDDCTIPPDFLARLVGVFEETGADIVAGAVTTHGGHRVKFGDQRETVSRANVWTHTIEAATFYRRDILTRLGGFDVTLGTGGPTRWQSGEGTDLVLRAITEGAHVVYEPSLVVTEHQVATTGGDYLGKVRRYARGTGRVYRLHYPWHHRGLVVAKPAAAALAHTLRGDRERAAQKYQAALGRIEGMR